MPIDKKLERLIEVECCEKEDLLEALDHGVLVSNLAVLLSKELGMNEDFCYEMSQAGMVHDIGKLKLGKYLYGRKLDALTIEETKYVRMHPTIGYHILSNYGYSDIILQSVYHHHENYDGSGYPNNLVGEAIPCGARIIRTCDVFAALVSERRYRAAFDFGTAMELMIEEVKNFDMQIYLAFLRCVHSEEFVEVQKLIDNINKKNYVWREKPKEEYIYNRYPSREVYSI